MSSAVNSLQIISFGLKISISHTRKINRRQLLERIAAILPNCEFIETESADFNFQVEHDGEFYVLLLNGEKVIQAAAAEAMLDYFETNLRITIAEFAPEKVFLHAGVVGWKERAIIIPATSFRGKTTLVAELVRRGAVYYSDEYAVLDADGFVHPFPKMLSMRGIIDDFTQLDLPVSDFNGVAGERPIPVGMVLLTEFSAAAEWRPERLTAGAGIMEILPHTIPIRLNPEFTLNILNKMASRAIIVKTARGEAKQFAEIILEFFNQEVVPEHLKTDN